MDTKPPSRLIQDRALSVVASEIPPGITLAQYRKRYAVPQGTLARPRMRRLGGRR